MVQEEGPDGPKMVGKPGKVFLFDLVEIDRNANNKNITEVFEDVMAKIYPDGNTDQILYVVSDAASYMKLAASNLQKKYKKMVFVTCLAHGMHNVAAEIPKVLKHANAVVASNKAVFLKSNQRMRIFREMNPTIPRPPKPAQTRWGTVINACLYYVNYFDEVKNVVDTLDSKDAASIAEAKKAMGSSKAKTELNEVKYYLGTLPNVIKKLETRHETLDNTLQTMQATIRIMEQYADRVKPTGPHFRKKLSDVLFNNHGYEIMCQIDSILKGIEINFDRVKKTRPDIKIPALEKDDFPYFEFAPMSSADAERAFSRYGTIFSEMRQSLTVENARMMLYINWNEPGIYSIDFCL